MKKLMILMAMFFLMAWWPVSPSLAENYSWESELSPEIMMTWEEQEQEPVDGGDGYFYATCLAPKDSKFEKVENWGMMRGYS